MDDCPPQPDCLLEGRLVRIRPLGLADIPDMLSWRRHQDPLFQDYNLPFTTVDAGERWLAKRRETRWAYAIRDLNGLLVGHLSLRNLLAPRSSRLGISLAPGHVGRGYGKDALCTFLDYYFRVLGFGELQLDVNAANTRARRLYDSLGFQLVGSFWLKAPPGLFWKKEYRVYWAEGKIRFDEMHLLASEWWRVRALLR